MEHILNFEDSNFEKELFGNYDKNIKALEEKLSINIILRDDKTFIIGDMLISAQEY